jgi:hypothetical protein
MVRAVLACALALPTHAAVAMQQGAPPTPKLEQPSGWPLVGYILAAVMMVAAVFLSVRTSNRQDIDESGASNP